MRINGKHHGPLPTGPTLRAAIYCRVSAEDVRDTKNKSVEHQREQALAYAAKKGWTVKPEHVFVDDGISGGEFVSRPGFARLLASLPKRGKAPFDVLIMSELSRLGRDTHRTPFYVAELLDAGVRIFYYLNDAEEKGDSPEARLMTSVRAYSDEAYRIRTGERVRNKLAEKARQGFSAGGSCFGYDNVEVKGTNGLGEQVRSHVDYRINEQQAETVRGIFRMYLAGYGHTAVAKCLNGEPAYRRESKQFFKGQRPAGPRTGTGSWAPSSIRSMLYNSRYVGKIRYGAVRRVWRGGTKKRVRDGQVTYADRPDLRVVPQDLWDAVEKRLKAVRQAYVRENNGTLWGRPERGEHSKYLLSGIAKCGLCGASMIATRGVGSGRKMYARYCCSHNINRGKTVCANNVRENQDVLNAKVIEAIERAVLTPERVKNTLNEALQLAKQRRKQEPDNSKKLEADIKRLERELANLNAACAEGRIKPDSLVAEIEKREAAIKALKDDLARSPHRLKYGHDDLEALRLTMVERMGKFQDMMRDRHNVAVARQALRKLLNGPIRCTPIVKADGRRAYSIRGETKLGALLSSASVTLVPRKGLEPPQCCHR